MDTSDWLTKLRLGRLRRHSAPVTFCDVADCFSEDEWRLFHEWQKELFKNVMMEIQQTLISLGPVIATSVFSLRAEEKRDLGPINHCIPGRTNSYAHSKRTAVSSSSGCKRNREEIQYRTDPPHNDPTQSNGFLHPVLDNISQMGRGMEPRFKDDHNTRANATRTGDTFDGFDVFRIKGEDHVVRDRRESECLNPGRRATAPGSSSILNDEDAAHSMTQQGSERRENTIHLTAQEVIPPVNSFSIKEEEETYQMDRQDCAIMESINVPIGINLSTNSIERRVNNLEQTSMSGNCVRNFSHKIDFKNHHRSEQDPLDVFSDESNVTNEGPSSFKQKVEQTEPNTSTRTKCGKGFGESSTLNPHQRIHTGSKLYICSQCKRGFILSENETTHHRINNGELQNICNECETSCSQSPNINKYHVAVRPYTCAECGKSFRESQSLKIHQRVHTGEKPYVCSQCGKHFRQLPHLLKHRRLHTGEKPYKCSVCERPFIDSSNLKRHQKIHFKN